MYKLLIIINLTVKNVWQQFLPKNNWNIKLAICVCFEDELNNVYDMWFW